MCAGVLTRRPWWKKYEGITSPSLLTISRTITKARNVVCIFGRTSSVVWHNDWSFLQFTFRSWIKFFSSEKDYSIPNVPSLFKRCLALVIQFSLLVWDLNCPLCITYVCTRCLHRPHIIDVHLSMCTSLHSALMDCLTDGRLDRTEEFRHPDNVQTPATLFLVRIRNGCHIATLKRTAGQDSGMQCSWMWSALQPKRWLYYASSFPECSSIRPCSGWKKKQGLTMAYKILHHWEGVPSNTCRTL